VIEETPPYLSQTTRKIVVFGGQASGKSSFITRICHSCFPLVYRRTVGLEILCMNLTTRQNPPIRLVFVEVPMEECRSEYASDVLDNLLRSCDGILLFVESTSQDSVIELDFIHSCIVASLRRIQAKSQIGKAGVGDDNDDSDAIHPSISHEALLSRIPTFLIVSKWDLVSKKRAQPILSQPALDTFVQCNGLMAWKHLSSMTQKNTATDIVVSLCTCISHREEYARRQSSELMPEVMTAPVMEQSGDVHASNHERRGTNMLEHAVAIAATDSSRLVGQPVPRAVTQLDSSASTRLAPDQLDRERLRIATTVEYDYQQLLVELSGVEKVAAADRHEDIQALREKIGGDLQKMLDQLSVRGDGQSLDVAGSVSLKDAADLERSEEEEGTTAVSSGSSLLPPLTQSLLLRLRLEHASNMKNWRKLVLSLQVDAQMSTLLSPLMAHRQVLRTSSLTGPDNRSVTEDMSDVTSEASASRATLSCMEGTNTTTAASHSLRSNGSKLPVLGFSFRES
jgi:GTPase SAR1 family protein